MADSKAAVLGHLRATAAAYRRNPGVLRFGEHALQRMRERAIVVADVIRAFTAPKPEDVRESLNSEGRWEVRADIDSQRFYVVVVLLKRPDAVVVTVVRPGDRRSRDR